MTSAARRRSSGFTLVEVCISALIIAIGATALFAVALSTRRTVAVSPLREQMNQYARKLTEDLKAYVTKDFSNMTGAPDNFLFPGHPSWAFPGDAGNAWALSYGNHDATALLPATLKAPAAPMATLKYTVKAPSAGDPNVRQVVVTTNWTEPD